jgi:hypothetical protein
VAECAIEKFTKKLLGESEVEAVLMRLDRLTEEEARMTVAQTLGVVHGLVGNVKVVMEGVSRLHHWLLVLYSRLIRWQSIDEQYPTRPGYVSRRICVHLLTWGCSRNSRNPQ